MRERVLMVLIVLAIFAKTYSNRYGRQTAVKHTPVLNVLEVRSMFVRRGTTLNAWAKSRGFCGMYAHLSVRGLRRGPVARRIVIAVKQELGV